MVILEVETKPLSYTKIKKSEYTGERRKCECLVSGGGVGVE